MLKSPLQEEAPHPSQVAEIRVVGGVQECDDGQMYLTKRKNSSKIEHNINKNSKDTMSYWYAKSVLE